MQTMETHLHCIPINFVVILKWLSFLSLHWANALNTNQPRMFIIPCVSNINSTGTSSCMVQMGQTYIKLNVVYPGRYIYRRTVSHGCWLDIQNMAPQKIGTLSTIVTVLKIVQSGGCNETITFAYQSRDLKNAYIDYTKAVPFPTGLTGSARYLHDCKSTHCMCIIYSEGVRILRLLNLKNNQSSSIQVSKYSVKTMGTILIENINTNGDIIILTKIPRTDVSFDLYHEHTSPDADLAIFCGDEPNANGELAFLHPMPRSAFFRLPPMSHTSIELCGTDSRFLYAFNVIRHSFYATKQLKMSPLRSLPVIMNVTGVDTVSKSLDITGKTFELVRVETDNELHVAISSYTYERAIHPLDNTSAIFRRWYLQNATSNMTCSIRTTPKVTESTSSATYGTTYTSNVPHVHALANGCTCKCTRQHISPSYDDLQISMLETKERLLIKKEYLSRTFRQKNSMPDNRLTSVILGHVGIIFIVVVLGSLMFLDVLRFYRFLQPLFLFKITKRVGPSDRC